MSTQILVVEDEPSIRELIGITLKHAGFRPVLTEDVVQANRYIQAEMPTLVILDWMLPKTSGIEFLRELRASAQTRQLPVLMLTARADEGDRLSGFDAGTDDYLTKPFSPREMVARVKALLRRADPATDTQKLEVNGLSLDPVTHRVHALGQEIKLGPIEFKLLGHFLRNPERVFSREQLLSRVWADAETVEVRTVDVQVRRLRQALEPSGLDKLLETVRGTGYRLHIE